MEQRILVIGKNSFIGKHFKLKSQFKSIDTVSLREKKPGEIFFKDYDVVLYLPAIVHQTSKIPEDEYYRVNRDLCLNVAQRAKKDEIKQFIFLSTIKVYGSKNDNTIRNEFSDCFPDDAYGKSKYQAEKGLQALEDDHFKVSILRTPLVYGEGVKANMLKIVRIVEKYNILPFAGIKNKRSFTYAGNLVSYIDCIIDKNASGTFIAMDDKSLSTTDLVTLIAKNLNKKLKLFKIPGFLVKTGFFIFPGIFKRLFSSLVFNNDFTNSTLNYNQPFSTEQGIERMVNDYLKSQKS